MSIPQVVDRDERTESVENHSYRWAYAVLTCALLVDVMYRGFFRQEAAWDLMALVFLGGVICTIYQARQKTLSHGWVMKIVLGVIASAIAAFVAAFVMQH